MSIRDTSAQDQTIGATAATALANRSRRRRNLLLATGGGALLLATVWLAQGLSLIHI